MARRRSRSKAVRGRPNLLWIASAGEFALIQHNTVWDAILVPADWSGTVTEQQCTLERIVLMAFTKTITNDGVAHSENTVLFLGNANEQGGSSISDISDPAEFPDFCESYDRILQWGRLEWDASSTIAGFWPVQYSQLPQPVMNVQCRRRLMGDDVVRFGCGGYYAEAIDETHYVGWFARCLVRIGLK